MRPSRRLVLVLLAPGLALAAWVLLAILALKVLTGGRIAIAPDAAGPALAAVIALWGAATVAGSRVMLRWWRMYLLEPARLLNGARILTSDLSATRLPVAEGAPPILRLLGAEIELLARQRDEMRLDMARLVDEASRSVSDQRDQLAALMAELDHAVVVCNRDGRVLLLNDRARDLAQRLGGGVLGLGRSIDAMLDPAALSHALDTVKGRMARGVAATAARAQFVTATPSGQLLQVSLSPIRDADGAHAMSGFMLLVDDITLDQHQRSLRREVAQRMTEATRGSVAILQTALEILDDPHLPAEDRDRFRAVVRAEAAAMGDRIKEDAAAESQALAARWPLSDMLGSDLMAAAVRRLGDTTGTPITTEPMPEGLWLRIDSFGLIQALDFMAGAIGLLQPDPALWLRLGRGSSHAHLDFGWVARAGTPPPDPARLTALPAQEIRINGQGLGVSPREIIERHGGEIWLERGPGPGEQRHPFFRMLLPLAADEVAEADTPAGARPEFYDFDLFAAATGGAADDQPLTALTFTVFDCETTGLDPAGGDEIIQIGAVRIVNGRILRGETINQLVDPQCPIPEAGIAIHHIHPDMVRGQPTIAQALPQFHRFAAGSVLVGHNVAFDMRFLKLKETATGCVFDHPVLDTLLLSSIVHPAEQSHSLEAIAERLGITIGGRHTALGDALATAEVFARLVPLLARQGIVTLAQAREASDRSQFARLRY